MDWTQRAKAAERAARAAGEMLVHHGALRFKEKGENDFVTELDPKSEALIRETLLAEFPEDAFYGEESGGAEHAHGRWIVDPIDGTASFLRGQHGWCISIAYESEGELVVGCVYAPDTDEMFLAIRGQGATLNGEPIHVSPISEPRRAILHFGYGHIAHESFNRFTALIPDLFSKISDVRRYGTAAYGICTLACGRSDLFAELGLSLYDFAAAKVILEEAGGKMTGWPSEADATITGNVLASNGLLHDFLLKTMH